MTVRTPLLLLFAALIGVGCDSADTDGPAPARVTFRALAASSKASAISVNEVKLLVRELEFDRADDDSEEGEDFEVENFVVNLALDGTTTTVLEGEIPDGTYDEVEFEVHRPDATEAIPDAEFRDGESGDERYSVIVRGTSDGNPFELKIRRSFEQEVEFAEPIVVDGTTDLIGIAIEVDVSSWFVDEVGAELNPLEAADLPAIESAIERSFDSFEELDD